MTNSADAKPRTAADLVRAWLAEANEADAGDSWGNRRSAPRFYWTAQLDVYVFDARGRAQKFIAAARDVSATGVSFHMREPLKPKQRVLVCQCGQQEGVYGTVASVTQSVGQYFVGVAFGFDARVQ